MKTDESQEGGDIKGAISQLQRTVEEMKKSMSFSESAPRTYRQRTYRPNDKTICWNCGKPEHTRANCRKRNIPRKSVAKDVFKNGRMLKECQYCKNLFKSKKELWEHYRTDHLDVRRFYCKTCVYTTNSKYHLEVHMNIHAVAQIHKCDICKVSFKTKLSLARHRRENHTKDIFHECKYCNFKTKRLESLKNHKELHAKGKTSNVQDVTSTQPVN
ncbi:hypothetical protein LAZ67_3000719 [Cordylochernes scorpioides]|uniref:Uncharacterized protein n=1 Tax=Cordylochernes scorpioides TaxID=51811 RepID=A0ABY6K844_9ARAC|nr:hypothetical protein LAZ67_3000719 [Cordylochernes scorpioides]